MPASLGPFLTAWTIRAALVCFVAYVASQLAVPSLLSPRLRRVVWTAGCVLFDVNVASAFHFSYHWSHTAAWRHTAERTDQMLGIPFGGGIYFSYLFLALWWVDVLWLWLTPWPPGEPTAETAGRIASARPGQRDAIDMPAFENGRALWPNWRIALHFYLIFIAIQGAMVFEGGPVRWAGAAACVAIISLIATRAYNTATAAAA